MIWVIVGYMWLFLHRPFEIWQWMADLRVERVYMLLTLAAWLTAGNKQFTANRIISAISMVAIAIFLSGMLSPYSSPFDNLAMQNWFKLLAFYLLVSTCVKTEQDLKIIVTGFLVSFFLYMAHSYYEFRAGRYVYNMGTVRMVGIDLTMNNPNAFGASIVIHLALLLPLFVIVKKRWHYLFILAYFLLSVRCIQLTGSRSSFLGLGSLLVGGGLISKRRLLFIPIIFVAAIVVWFTLNENLKERYLSIIDPTINESATQSAQGRTQGFWDGVKNWQRSPIVGVGPEMHGIACGSGHLSHHLYGQVIGELGSIGAFAYLWLIICFGLNHKDAYQYYKRLERYGRAKEGLYCFRVSLMTFCGVLMLLYFGFGGHNAFRYNWVWFAALQASAVSLLAEKTERLEKFPRIG